MQQRIEPVKLKLDSPQFHALFTPALRKLATLFESNNYELRICGLLILSDLVTLLFCPGGTPRDLLLGEVPHDIDLATTATPAQMIELFTHEHIPILRDAGQKNGTVMCRIDKENFEVRSSFCNCFEYHFNQVTTLRGSVVRQNINAWQLDAEHRDLTVNSLFLG